VALVAKSCQGVGACKKLAAGASGNTIRIRSSCIGGEACAYAAYANGEIESIIHSCSGNKACNRAAFGGRVKLIEEGCNADTACNNAAMNNINGILKIQNACNAIGACSFIAGSEDPPIGGDMNTSIYEIVDCCNDGGCAGSYDQLPNECYGDVDQPCESFYSKNDCQSNFCTWSGKGRNGECI